MTLKREHPPTEADQQAIEVATQHRLDAQTHTTEATKLGRVEFETVDGLPNGAATYDTHPSLRERTLLWRHQMHEQNHQKGNGTWVYRATSTSGIAPDERDPQLTPIEEPAPRA